MDEKTKSEAVAKSVERALCALEDSRDFRELREMNGNHCGTLQIRYLYFYRNAGLPKRDQKYNLRRAKRKPGTSKLRRAA